MKKEMTITELKQKEIEILKMKGETGVRQMKKQFITENNILSRIIKLENKTSQTDSRVDKLEAQMKKLMEKERLNV